MRRLSLPLVYLSAVLAGLLSLPATPVQAGEKLVYAVVHKGPGFEAAKTEIFAVDPDRPEPRLIFSDEKSPILLKEQLYTLHFPATGGDKIFAHAMDRGQAPAPPNSGALYEISADSSALPRRIAPVLGEESLVDIAVSPDGKRAGYINRLKGSEYFFIHDTASGKLLQQLDVTEKFLDCFAVSFGWLPTGDTLFFSLDTGDTDDSSEESYGRVGTYLMDEDGQHFRKVADPPPREGFFPPEGVRMLGALPTGEYLFETVQHRKRTRPAPDVIKLALIRFDARSRRAHEIPFVPASTLPRNPMLAYSLSPSGRYLALTPETVSASTTAQDIWVQDLETATVTKLVSRSVKGSDGPFLGLIGWIK